MEGAAGEGIVQTVTAGPAVPDVRVAEPELGPLGRILVVTSIVAGVAVGALSGFGLFWFLPYGLVGAVLAIRRPRHRVGWILLVMAWTHALLILPVNSTVAQFETGPPADVALSAILASLAASAILPLYGLLAIVLPTGRLPAGRWGRVVQFGLAAALIVEALVFVAPRTSLILPGFPNGVIVRNPAALAPDASLWALFPREAAFPILLAMLLIAAISVIHRFRQATGIERQQLRWIGASLTLVAFTFMLGLIIPALIPGSEENATLPAVFAFATVPLAIGVAVLRYRLYEIDTIINRALVYGLLTAILAGGSAAAVGLIQSLFVGILGPGSTVTIVVTTLLVVSAFNPIKTRLQTIVDQRFKPAPDPAASLKAFVAEVRESLSRPDRDRTFRRLLDLTVPELATAAEIEWTGDDGTPRRAAAGAEVAVLPVVVPASVGEVTVEMRLAGTGAARAQEPVRAALVAILEETPTAMA